MKQILRITTVACALAVAQAHAGVSPDEAAKLKTELTPLGAERAGNKDGSIPAWDGGYTKVPSGFKSGQPRPDPFASEKPLYSITAKNMDAHAEVLTDGLKYMLKKYPTYRIDVYPTHRTAAAPQWVYDNTFANATRAKTTHEGLSVEGAHGGIPFPIPKTGAEAMWNHLLRWCGDSTRQGTTVYVVAGGKPVLASNTMTDFQFPYYFKEGSADDKKQDYWDVYLATTEPAFKAGEVILGRDSIDQAGTGRQVWQYLVGQRRVRRAPSLAYDTPNTVTSGVDFFDEAMMFNGGLEKYNWKLVGKREMLVPYNENGLELRKVDDVLGPNYLNPDAVRFELHRVWVVDAELAPGKRHVLPKRRYYLDEDSWSVLLSDGWDARGELWHVGIALPFLAFEIPGQIEWAWVTHDVQKGSYSSTTMNGQPDQWTAVARYPADYFTPEALAGRGIR